MEKPLTTKTSKIRTYFQGCYPKFFSLSCWSNRIIGKYKFFINLDFLFLKPFSLSLKF